jgi:two-component sensor histidine kinase/CheY-like chemotaxis protein
LRELESCVGRPNCCKARALKHTPRRGARDLLGAVEGPEEKARLIEALGHDSKAPLHILSLSLQTLLLRSWDPETLEILESAESAFSELAALHEDLLDALRFGVGASHPREERISLSALFAELKRRFKRRAEHEGVEIRVSETRIWCVTNRHYLVRILANLIENALKHADARRIAVGARLKPEDSLILEVADDGRGISEQELPYVFEEWFRGRRAIATGTRGQGLGLWAVQRCVQALGGSITVDSVVDRGTRFIVDIPVYAERLPLSPKLPTVGAGSLAGKVVVILDDDEDVVRALRTSVESLGARAVSAADELYLLARIGSLEVPPDLFLLDFNLGGRTIERTLKLLQGKYGEALRAIIITAHSSDERVTRLGQEFQIVRKPLTSQCLQQIVSTLSVESSGATG